MRKCPHGDIRHCPLYVAAHDGEISHYGCDDGRLNEDGCAVTRELSYASAVERLRRHRPLLIAQCQFNELEIDRVEQMERNRRLNGIH